MRLLKANKDVVSQLDEPLKCIAETTLEFQALIRSFSLAMHHQHNISTKPRKSLICTWILPVLKTLTVTHREEGQIREGYGR